MTRLPFDPDRLKPQDAGKPARREQARYGSLDDKRPLTVSQVTELIKKVLADRMPGRVRVVGEVSNFSDRGHWYLSLKDEQNVLNCVMWTSAARKAGFVPERGQQVVATGRVDLYGPQGRLQLYIDRLEPVGQGALELRFRQLCDELRKAGHFDDDRKKPLPTFPRHVAIVTSATGAAVHDVVHTAQHRWAGVRLTVVDVRVQGEEAAAEIAHALAALSTARDRLEVDAVILTRGGGSLEDLWAFNERIVADAVYHSTLPIVAAIGHETDTTIAELVADLRCSTPTQAAMRLIGDAAEERQRLDQTARGLARTLLRRLDHERTRLRAAARHPFFAQPAQRLDQQRRRLDELSSRMNMVVRHHLLQRRQQLSERQQALRRFDPRVRIEVGRQRVDGITHRLRQGTQIHIKRQTERLTALDLRLGSVGPPSVLSRGYSITTTRRGEVVRSADQVEAGAQIHTRLASGRLRSTVVDAETDQTSAPPDAKSGPKPVKAPDAASQGGLFDA